MYPEAGGSSSFARHAFNEFWSFFAAWAQMLNYTITIAISAFFVPHYLGGLFWDELRHGPGDIIFAIGADRPAVAGQRPRRQGVGGRQHRPGRRRLPHAAAARRGRPVPGLQPRHADRQRVLRHRADVEGLLRRDPDRHDRLHGHRDDLEHGRGGQGRGEDDPGGDQPRGDRRLRDLLAAADGRAERAAGDPGRRRPLHDAARPPRGAGRLRRRPGARRRQALRPGLPAGAGGDLRRHPGGDDPGHRLQRGDHRRLAAGVLDGHPPPDARPAAPAAPQVRHALHRDHDLRRDRLHRGDPGQGRLPRQHVRLRGDAVVHDRPPRGHPAAAGQARRAAARGRARATSGSAAAARSRCSRSSAASARCWPSSSSPRCTSTSRWPASAG